MNREARRCLLLDLGKVLVAVNYEEFARRMKRLTGLDPGQLQAMFAAGQLGKRFEAGLISGRDFFDEICRRTGACLDFEAFAAAWNSMIGPPMIADSLLADLARRTRLWIISNTNEMHYRHMTGRFDFLRRFEGCVLSYEVGVAKPDARIFRAALERMQAPASQVVFVDDLEANVAAARALGIDAFRFLDPDQFASELAARGLLLKAPNLREGGGHDQH